jgi:3D (Asp-Asp-Asp) domain-containing protein
MRPAIAGALFLTSCATAGSTWMEQPLIGDMASDETPAPPELQATRRTPSRRALASKTLGDPEPAVHYGPDFPVETAPERVVAAPLAGRVLGTFRNTYYDFPSEQDFTGELVAIKSPQCTTLKDVPRGFYEALCVQGSGTLSTGPTVSFSKRDCACAEVCPRTGQRICFDALDAAQFPWGRGATGHAITPLLTVAVDSDVIPLLAPIYIPEFDGMPRDAGAGALHDGCFIAQDRGLRVKGKHVDVFTGDDSMTRLWNQRVPSNKGVTVVLDSPRCARATVPASLPRSSERSSTRDAP